MSKENTAATAGRGFLVITAAKLWFMLGGALINFGLPYIFGDSLYGQYIDLNNTLSIFSMVMITGVMQSVSKFVAEHPHEAQGVMRQAYRFMWVLGALIGGGFILGAPWIAEARANPQLVNGYRAAGVILFSYGLYTVYIGTLNGQKLFFRQALYDIGFSSMKVTLILGFAFLGLGVVGAFSGFALAALIIMLLATWRVSRGQQPGPQAPDFYSFAAKVMLYALTFNLIFKLDVLMLKPAIQALVASGASAWVGVEPDALLGVYGLALNISRIPWQATIAITFVVFPMVSEASFSQDRERTRLYIRQTLRYTMILAGGASVVLAAVPQAVVGLLPAQFAQASLALAWLAPAYFLFSLFNVINTLLMSAGRAGAALWVGLLTVGLAALLYTLMLPGAADPSALLLRVGLATLLAFAGGLFLGAALLWQRFGPPVPLLTALRISLLGSALVLIGRQIPPTGQLLSLSLAVGVGLCFLLGLIITREFGAEDKARLMKILRRGG